LAAYRRADARGADDAALRLGMLHERRGELEEAEAAYRRAASQGARGASGRARAVRESLRGSRR
jgi:TPR repeat protein